LKVERYQISRVISKKGEKEEIPEVTAEIICEIIEGAFNI
jgi:hypothetical protein